MTNEEWGRVKSIFAAAVEREPHERPAFLDSACGGDATLRREVESLLASDEAAEEFIEQPALLALSGDLLPEDGDDPLIGGRIGAYLVKRELARGGMGTVYLAERADEQFDQKVAVKLVKRGMDTDFILERFRHERQILASLDHPNIAKILDAGTTDRGLPYFVMEYVEGVPIDRYCDDHNLDTYERLELFSRICAAVHYAHQNLVVHRDLKPSNILVTPAGVPKLLDFGIAKLLRAESFAASLVLTQPDQRLLTPEYASPEQVRGGTITTASDVYSLGVLLYELLTGHRPYRLRTRALEELERIICEEEPEKPSTVIGRVEEVEHGRAGPTTLTPERVSQTRDGQPEKLRRRLAGDVDNIVLMAMRKEPQRRYASAEEFAQDISRHLRGLPVIAQKDTFGYRAGKFVTRHKAGVGAAALVALALVGGIVATTWQARIARAERARADRRFNDVRGLANSFMFEIHGAIENLPGSTSARKLLVRKALEYLDSLAQESGNDAALQGELATAYIKVGDVQGNPYSANVGDLPGALSSYRKALAISEQRQAKNPSDVQARRDVATAYERVGDMQSMTSEVAAALESQRHALSLREELAAARPSDPDTLRELATSYNKVGDTLGWMGDAAGALDSHRKALAVSERLGDAADAARSHNKVGDVLAQLDDPAAALESYRKAAAIAESLLKNDPNYTKARRHRAISYAKIGDTLLATGETAGALESYRKALSIREELAAADGANAQARRDLAISYITFGDALSSSGNVSEGLANTRQAVAVFEKLAESDPGNVGAREDLVLAYNRAGAALSAAGDPEGALKNYRQALEIAERLSAADPSDMEARQALANSCIKLGDLYAAMATASRADSTARWREARAWYERSQQILNEMRERNALSAAAASMYDKAAAELARCEKALAGAR